MQASMFKCYSYRHVAQHFILETMNNLSCIHACMHLSEYYPTALPMLTDISNRSTTFKIHNNLLGAK